MSILLFRAYPHDDPSGTTLGTFTQAYDKWVSLEHNALGGGGFTINRHDSQAAWATPGNYIRAWRDVVSGAAKAGFWLDSGGDAIVNEDEEGGDEWKRGGAGPIVVLREARVDDRVFAGGDGNVQEARGRWHWDDAQPGKVLNRLLNEAKARGCFPFVTWDFSATQDSDGNPWSNETARRFDIPIGIDLLEVVGEMREADMVVEMDAEFVLHMWEHPHGSDLSASITFAKGTDLRDSSERQVMAREGRSRALVEGTTEDGDPRYHHAGNDGYETTLGRRKELFVSYPRTGTGSWLRRVGARRLRRSMKLYSGPLTLGVLDTTGQVALVDYLPGDTVTIDIPGEYEETTDELQSITLKDRPEGAGEYDVILDFGDLGYDPVTGADFSGGRTGTQPGGGGGKGGDGPPLTESGGVRGGCCNPIPTGPNDLISWGDANIMGFEQGHTSGTSHSITLPDGSGYLGGVVGGDIIDRQVLVFMMTVDELPGGGGGLDNMASPWSLILAQVIACTHGFFPFNNGHPNMQTKVFRLDADAFPSELPETGATVVIASDDAIEVLWVSVLVGGTGGALTVGPSATDWDVPDWSSGLPAIATGNRALYFSIAYNQFWNNSTHGLGLSAEDHDTPVIGGLPADFARLTQAVGGDKIINVDYAFSPVDTGGATPTLSMTGYIGSSSGSQDFIITQLYGIEVRTTASGEITPGPTWEGGNPLIYDGGNVPPYTIADGVVTITSDTVFDVWAWYAIAPPELPMSIADWIISQRFNLTTAGSLTDAGERDLSIGADFDGKYLAAAVRFGDAIHPQGVAVVDDEESFTAKDIIEGEDYVFQVKWDGTTLYARFWLEADGEPAADDWDVQSVTLGPALDPEGDGVDRFYYAVGLGNNGGTAQVLVLPSPTIEGLALPGESVDWEIVPMVGAVGTTRYPYDELSLHVRVDGQMLGGTAFTMDGAAGTFTLDEAPYTDPADPTGSSVVEARYTRT